MAHYLLTKSCRQHCYIQFHSRFQRLSPRRHPRKWKQKKKWTYQIYILQQDGYFGNHLKVVLVFYEVFAVPNTGCALLTEPHGRDFLKPKGNRKLCQIQIRTKVSSQCTKVAKDLSSPEMGVGFIWEFKEHYYFKI